MALVPKDFDDPLIRVGTVLRSIPIASDQETVIVTDVIVTADGPGIQVWSKEDGHWWLDANLTTLFHEWEVVDPND